MLARSLAFLAALASCTAACFAASTATFVTPQRMSVAGGETKRFSVLFLDSGGHPSAGEAVRFANDACGRFANGLFFFDTVTDSNGIANADFTALVPAGITCWLTAGAGAVARFDVETYIASLAYASALDVPARPTPGQPFTLNVAAMFGVYDLYNVDVSARVVDGTVSATISPAVQSTGDAGSAAFTVTPDSRVGRFDIELTVAGNTKVVHVLEPAVGMQDLWWAGAAESGWGMSLVQHPSGVLFSVIYAYGATGEPTWYVMPGGTWNSDHTVISGPLYSPRGAPWSAYDANRFVPGEPAGNATLTFFDVNTAALDYEISGVAGHKNISRQGFGRPDGLSRPSLSDMWWGGVAQNGWGIGLLQQQGSLFTVWYTYDVIGAPTWFVIPDGSWSDVNTYSGRVYRTTGSPWLAAPFDPSKTIATDVGSLTWHFTLAGATLAYTVDGIAGTMDLVRQPF
jgi:hypothetical protein